MKNYKQLGLLILLLIGVNFMARAQRSDTVYVKSIKGRSWKIVEKLNIKDPQKEIEVRNIIANQYMDLNDVYMARDAKLGDLKAKTELTKFAKNKKTEKIQQWTQNKIDRLHLQYIKNLNKNLNEEQVIGVKDGMTYGVVPLTFAAYQEMLPNLTQQQKNQIYIWLVEAREHAMDAESSDKKHAWFGKYKGKVNNYLSAEGIDMKKAGGEWQARIKKEKAEKGN
ncbi:DUF3826 domain-containing protein [Pedobacter alpinus]|uniref:DUF3826 domain-containing protein n=1 Tax=Pedobacter alpinus TaxID=1590643 RepID=A0ABW5TLW8_9SPHI